MFHVLYLPSLIDAHVSYCHLCHKLDHGSQKILPLHHLKDFLPSQATLHCSCYKYSFHRISGRFKTNKNQEHFFIMSKYG
jgi:hypothetical protein